MSVLKKEFPSTYRIQDNSEEYYTIHVRNLNILDRPQGVQIL